MSLTLTVFNGEVFFESSSPVTPLMTASISATFLISIFRHSSNSSGVTACRNPNPNLRSEVLVYPRNHRAFYERKRRDIFFGTPAPQIEWFYMCQSRFIVWVIRVQQVGIVSIEI